MELASRMRHPVVTIPADASLAHARALMQHHQIRHLPVLQAGRLVGMVTDRQLRGAEASCLPALARYEARTLLGRLLVCDVMTRRFVQRPPEALVLEAAWLIWTGQTESIVIVEREQLVGIVTASDLLTCLIEVGEQRLLPTYRHILMATNFSAAAEHALRTAVALTRQHHAVLTMLHVLTPLGRALAEDVDHVPIGMLEEIHLARKNDALQRLMALTECYDDLQVTSHLAEGEPGAAIVSMAERVNADLIVLGSRDRGSWQRFWMSGIAVSVQRSAPCPVLIVTT